MTILSHTTLPLEEQAAHCREKLAALRTVTNGKNAAEMSLKSAPWRMRLKEVEQQLAEKQAALPFPKQAFPRGRWTSQRRARV